MPPRFAYWTILVGGLPTAFRAAERGEIEPTFRRLRDKHPDAELRWFARGKLWASPAEASEALERQKARGQRPGFADRDRNWRPGGAHRDPRQPYKDAKKRENQKRRERRFEFKKDSGPQAPGSRRDDNRAKWAPPEPRAQGPKPAWRPSGDRPPQKAWDKPKPWQRPPGGDRRPNAGERPGPKAQSPKPAWRPIEDRPRKRSSDQPGPKTDTGRPPGRARWSGAGERKGPGKGRRR